MPDDGVLHHFPEAASLAVLEAALAAVELALREEHPALEHTQLDPEHDLSSLALTGYLILTRSIELRRLVRFYCAGVGRTARFHFDADADDLIT